MIAQVVGQMSDFTQQQQKYAGTGENCNIVVDVMSYPVNKISTKKFEWYLGLQVLRFWALAQTQSSQINVSISQKTGCKQKSQDI